MAGQFDSKVFDAEAFGDYVGRIPTVKTSELIARRVFIGNSEIHSLFTGAGSASYAKLPLYGAISGDAQNYDGTSDISVVTTPLYEFGTSVIGRANAWSEKDFTCDVNGVDYMDNVARQVAEYWQEVDEKTLISVLSGIFTLADSASDEALYAAKSDFISTHTLDITAETDSYVDGTTLNRAIQQSCGSGKGKFAVVLLHSAIATNLENLQLMNYLTYTDSAGITRDLSIGTWNGRSVIVSDSLPTAEGTGGTQYTSYILGVGSFFYEDIGAKVPYEMDRLPGENGGADVLYSRQRKIMQPFGFSYTKSNQATLSPTDDELSAGENWELAADSDGNIIDSKLIPIARIISLG